MSEDIDIVVVGAGAAGLMAAITGRRTNPDCRLLMLDSAKRVGAKILISGGGRCNVTHHEVDERGFAGSSPAAIRKILRRFDVSDTIKFFAGMGVELKREETGKLFPVTDRAQTIIDALLSAAHTAGVEVLTTRRVESVEKIGTAFRISGDWGSVDTRRVILATGGMSVPKTGSDGHGYSIVCSLGHTVTSQIFPALVPLLLPPEHCLCRLSGISADVELQLRSGTGRLIRSFCGSLLCTHFGLSGPVVLDMSRYYLDALISGADAALFVNWFPKKSQEQIETELRHHDRRNLRARLQEELPERLVLALCDEAQVDPMTAPHRLTREERRRMVRVLSRMQLPVTGNRGFRYAEVTAGGTPLRELNLNTLESRGCPGLFLCGEICDVDGRIGGFNFQWAWASGYVAGLSAAKSLSGVGRG